MKSSSSGSAGKLPIFPLLIALCLPFCAQSAGAALPGDCDGDGAVGIAEVQSAINMFLGLNPPLSCIDSDGSGSVSIAEVQSTINSFLGLAPAVSARGVTGLVRDPVNGNAPATGTLVRAYLTGGSGAPVASTTAASDGSFSVTGLDDGKSYYFVFSRSGYGDVSYYGITPSLAAETALQTVLLIPSGPLTQTVAINGYLQNAADNTPFPYLTLLFRAGIGATSGELVPQTRSTDSDGYYSRSYFPAGSYTAEVVAMDGASQQTLGYFTVHAVPGVSTYNNSQNFAVPAGSPGSGAYRAVLSWGNAPQDLDFHLTGPLAPGDTTTTIGSADTPRFHIDSAQVSYPYDSAVPFTRPTVPGPQTDAYLDFDQADHGTDNGPETLTILNQRSGPYRFYVYNNSGSGTLAGAQVSLYRGATLLNTFSVPAQAGNTWHVFDLDGSTVTAVNAVSTVSPDQTYTMARRIPGSAPDERLLFRPVVKAPRSR